MDSVKERCLTETLLEFWERSTDAVEVVDRLLLLQEFATRHVRRKRSYRTIRLSKKRTKWTRWCWVCRLRKPDVRHHIVQVQFGGSGGDGAEVCLCHNCHAAIHPWLRKVLGK